jgi:hypothetical protein
MIDRRTVNYFFDVWRYKMRKTIFWVIPALLMLLFAVLACNLPQTDGATSVPTETATPPVDGFVSETPTITETFTPEPPPTDTATLAPSVQDPLVIRAALCWWGPGPVYEVMSALKEGINVKLVGRGSISGWLLVDNPIYHVPCWVPSSYLQIDPSTDFNILPIYTPPPTPTPTITPTKTFTPSP